MRLLCATDLSARSDRAVRRGAKLARWRGAEMLPLQVVDDADQSARQAEAGKAVNAGIRAGAAQAADLVVRGAPRLAEELGRRHHCGMGRARSGSGAPVPVANLLPTAPLWPRPRHSGHVGGLGPRTARCPHGARPVQRRRGLAGMTAHRSRPSGNIATPFASGSP
ncbi:MAG: universal stress protein [Acetobacteraceae bacterium]|nr:universal stress protein [Acetobacteraceae bacterium]